MTSVVQILGDEEKLIGVADGLRGLPEDLAADEAMRRVVAERRFVHRSTSRFDLHLFFNGVDELASYLNQNSRRDSAAPRQVRRWRDAMDDPGNDRLRIREHMQLGLYERAELA